MITGEIHTAMLLASEAVSPDVATELVQLMAGEPVRSRTRPTRIAWSPEILTGVDCAAPVKDAKPPRIVGTLRSGVSVIEGHLLQASTWAVVRRAAAGRRLPWSHYLAAPGSVELIRSPPATALVRGFLESGPTPSTLDPGAVNARLLRDVQSNPWLDRSPPFKARRTRLRWVATPPEEDGRHYVGLTLHANDLRTLLLRTPVEDPQDLAEFCADLAMHDWLLTAVRDIVDRALGGPHGRGEALIRLRPVVENLVHTWMPGARVTGDLAALWRELERHARLAAQWEQAVVRVRDYVALTIAEGLLTAPVRDLAGAVSEPIRHP